MPADEPPDGWTPGGLTGAGSKARSDLDGLDTWGPLRDFVRERLPPAVRGARLDPGARGALALSGLALVAAAVAIFLAWSSAAQPATASRAAKVPGVAVPTLSAPTVATVTPSAAASLVVDVAGKVRRPGLVKLAGDARVADAIAAAGGLLPGATTTGLSLARHLVDGEQLLVGLPQPAPAVGPTTGVSAGAPVGPVNLNTATSTELDALPGIGPVLAQRIVDWRTSHGTFTSVDQLREVSGLGGKKFDALAPLVRV